MRRTQPNRETNSIAFSPTISKLNLVRISLTIYDLIFLQEQLRRRREEEDRIAQQNEFLRASLRGSRKLQALQDNPIETRQPVGIENDAFTTDDEIERILGELPQHCPKAITTTTTTVEAATTLFQIVHCQISVY